MAARRYYTSSPAYAALIGSLRISAADARTMAKRSYAVAAIILTPREADAEWQDAGLLAAVRYATHLAGPAKKTGRLGKPTPKAKYRRARKTKGRGR